MTQRVIIGRRGAPATLLGAALNALAEAGQ
jgi:hypothetical protein